MNEISNDVKEKIERMLEGRYNFTLRSHQEVLNASPIPIVGLIDMISIRSDRMKYYQEFQVHLKQLADRSGINQDEVKICLLDMLEEKRAIQDGGTEQMIVNVLYELGMSMDKIVDKRAHNKDYALNPKKVEKIWKADFQIVNKNDGRSK